MNTSSLNKIITIKLGDWVEGVKTGGMPTSGYVTDKKKNMLMLDNGKVVTGAILRHVANDVILVDDSRIVLAQSSQYHPNSRSVMPKTYEPKNHGTNINRRVFA